MDMERTLHAMIKTANGGLFYNCNKGKTLDAFMALSRSQAVGTKTQRWISQCLNNSRWRSLYYSTDTSISSLYHTDARRSHMRSQLKPETSKHLRAIPNSKYTRVTEQGNWEYQLARRLGAVPMTTLGLRTCNCGRAHLQTDPRHAEHCQVGGGMTAHHNVARDVIHDMHCDAGIHSVREVPFLVPGSDRRPADNLADIATSQYERIALDLTLTNTDLLHPDTPGRAATDAYNAKMHQTVTSTPDGAASLLPDVLREQRIHFLPLALERFGPHHLQVRKHIQQVSKIASHLRSSGDTTPPHSTSNGPPTSSAPRTPRLRSRLSKPAVCQLRATPRISTAPSVPPAPTSRSAPR